MKPVLHRGDLPEGLGFGPVIAVDTETMGLDPQRDRLWSDSATTLREGGTVARGDGFSSDGRLRNLTVTRPRGRVEGLKIEF